MLSSAKRTHVGRSPISDLGGFARRGTRFYLLALMVPGVLVHMASNQACCDTRAATGVPGPVLAGDARPPIIHISDIYTADALGRETHWRVGTEVSADSAANSVGRTSAVIAAPGPGQRLMLSGWVRDENGLTTVSCDGRPATVRPATKEELAMLGWPDGAAFETPVAVKAGVMAGVTVTATDPAGNVSRALVALHMAAPPGPEVLVLDPSPTRGIKASVRAQSSEHLIRVYGLARGKAAIVRITVAGKDAIIKEASADELKSVGWKAPALCFEAHARTSSLESLGAVLVEALDVAGVRAVVRVPVRDTNLRATVRIQPEKNTYRVGEHVRFTLSSDADVYVYLLHADPGGGLSAFLPNAVEPDPLVRGGVQRTFPSPSEEGKLGGQYGLIAQEPPGPDRVYCLTLPHPLPPSSTEELSSPGAVAAVLRGLARNVNADESSAGVVSLKDIARLATTAGGSWEIIPYEVTR